MKWSRLALLLFEIAILIFIGGCNQNTSSTSSEMGTVFQAPNIIYILADDMGYGDLNCYGQKTLQTPNQNG